MSTSVSFLRRITFINSSESSWVWIKCADLYEDENRVYAFLTIVNNSSKKIDASKISITPFDSDRAGMDSFAIKLPNLDLASGKEKEYPLPLILPKNTYGFNFSILSYSSKKHIEETLPPVAPVQNAEPSIEPETSPIEEETSSENSSDGVINDERMEILSQFSSEEAKPVSPLDAAAESNKPKPVLKENKIHQIRRMPFYLLIALGVLGIAIGILLFYSGVWGVRFYF